MIPEKVYKYALDITDFQEVSLPNGAELLTIQMQDGRPCLWAKVKVGVSDFDLVKIACFGTGHADVPEGAEYIATVQNHGWVWHFFRLRGAK